MFIYQCIGERFKSSFNFGLHDTTIGYNGRSIEQIQEVNADYSIICFLKKDTHVNNIFTSDDVPF